ncbi:hypothetical protein BGW36DRAFT_405023 [Talaromyces proteolyticus]|uniref:Uncharacterized protein n=1 Tax=Talaromyces proteolyticus TaxID=1131652 RepID=A0AAD4KXP5_9EURO|nr:uncharacterized protein BGW36DRAFT_405023 [Talaromyces proteolyticus]KAH8702175.1 hypothetical protein BGW36DRAFT_405023 [Talaromyces proteolyticus]
MADSPSSNTSFVTVFNPEQEEKDKVWVQKLQNARKKIIKAHYKSMFDFYINALEQAKTWWDANNKMTQRGMMEVTARAMISAEENFLNETLVPYMASIEDLVIEHENQFGEDKRLDGYFRTWMERVAACFPMIKGDVNKLIDLIEEGLEYKFAPYHYSEIKDILETPLATENRMIYWDKWNPKIQESDFLTQILDDEPAENVIETQRQKTFEAFKELQLKQIEAVRATVHNHSRNETEARFQDFSRKIEESFETLTNVKKDIKSSLMMQFSVYKFRFLAPLEEVYREGVPLAIREGRLSPGLSSQDFDRVKKEIFSELDKKSQAVKEIHYKPSG